MLSIGIFVPRKIKVLTFEACNVSWHSDIASLLFILLRNSSQNCNVATTRKKGAIVIKKKLTNK